MTSGAGDLRRGGFTIVEVLMVIAVITILFTLVMVASFNLRAKASLEATRSMIHRLRDGLEDYKRLRGSYPPDGFDSEVKDSRGRPIWGAACLYEFLSREIEVEETVAGQVRRSKHPPIMEFKLNEITLEDPDNPGRHDVVDGYKFPFHYDNTEDGVFNPLKHTEEPHLEHVEDHPPDPRSDPSVVPRIGAQRAGAYDIWSHGSSQGHNPEKADVSQTVGSWNVDVDQRAAASEGSGS